MQNSTRKNNKKDETYINRHLKITHRIMSLVLILMIFLGTIPSPTLYALPNEAGSYLTNENKPDGAENVLVKPEDAKPDSAIENEDELNPLLTENGEPLANSPRDNFVEKPNLPLVPEINELNTNDNVTSAVTLAEEDVVIADGVITALTEAGERKILDVDFVTIPSNFGTQQVHTIGERLFVNHRLKNVTLAEGITTVGKHAFQRTGLTSVTIPASLTTVDDYAFADNSIVAFNSTGLRTLGAYALFNNLLARVDLPVVTVGEKAFASNQLTNAVLPNATSLGSGAFFNNDSLVEVRMENENVTAETFKGSAFDQEAPVSLYINDTITGLAPLDNHYVINPITVTLTLKEKKSQGLLQPDDSIENRNDKWLKSLRISKHSQGEFPLTLRIPTVAGYTVSENQPGVNVTGTNATITLNTDLINNKQVTADIFFDMVAKPQIIVSESKQLVWPINVTLNKEEILQDVRFINSNGEEIEAFVDNNLQPFITLTPETLNAPNQEGNQIVKVTYRDDETNLSAEVDITFTYSSSTDENSEIIPGQGWLYSDFTYGANNNGFINGFSPSGLERLKTNKNVVLPGHHPVTKKKISGIRRRAFINMQMDTVNFEKLDNLKSIEEQAFANSGISGLLNFDKLLNLEVINLGAFSNIDDRKPKNSFTEIDFTPLKKLKKIGEFAFSKGALQKITLSDLPNLTEIKTSAFESNSLETVVLNNLDSLTKLGENVFYNNITLSEFSYNNLPSLATIGNEAFKNTNLGNLVLKNLPSLTTIANNAFQNSKLETLRFENLPKLQEINYGAFSNNLLSEVDFSTIPSLEMLSGFQNNNFESIVLNGLVNLHTIKQDAFRDNLNLRGNIVLENLPKLRNIDNSAFKTNLPEGQLDGLVLRDLPALETIKTSVFEGLKYSNLTLSNLPQLRELGDSIFADSRLTELTLENLPNLTRIGKFAFKRSSKLHTVNLKNLPKLSIIDEKAFESVPISNLNVEEGDVPALTTIARAAFLGTNLKGTFDINKFPALEVIGEEAFKNTKITNVIFDGHPKLRRILSNAFGQIEAKLSRIELTNMPNLEYVDGEAFSGIGSDDDKLTSVLVANNPNLTDLGAFSNNNNLREIELANLPKLDKILENSYKVVTNGLGISNIDLSAFTTLKTIEANAFLNSGLTLLQLPNSIENIGRQAYSKTKLTDVNLTNLTNLKSIGNNAFYKSLVAYNSFELPVTDEPILLGSHIAYLTDDQLNFKDKPGVKIKLTSTQPFKPAGANKPLVMHFANDSQITWENIIQNSEPSNPTIIYIDNVTDVERIKNAPPGLIINPGKTTIEFLETGTNNPMLGSSPEVRYLKVGDRIHRKSFASYNFKEMLTSPENLLTYHADTNEFEVVSQPANDSTIKFIYQPHEVVPSTDVQIDAEYGPKQNADFIHHQNPKFREVSITYVLTGVKVDEEFNTKLVVTLPPFTKKGGKGEAVNFPPDIKGYELVRDGYYNEETRQIIYEIARFPNENPPPINLRIGFAFEPLDTPKKIDQFVTGAVYLADGRRKGNESNRLIFRPDHRPMTFTKNVGHSQTSNHESAASVGSNNEYADYSLPYTFDLNNVHRRLERINIKDTLPTYNRKSENGTIETVQAVFNPAKNPEWTLNDDGTVSASVGYDPINSATTSTGYDSARLSSSLPTLILDFPRAVPQTVVNNGEIEAYVHNRQALDPEKITLSSSRRDTFSLRRETHVFDPIKSVKGKTLRIFDSNPLEDYDWEISVPLKKSSYFDADERKYYRTKYENLKIWDSLSNKDAQDNFRLAGFTPKQDMKLELYYKKMSGSKPTEKQMGRPNKTYQLKAGIRFDLPKEESLKTNVVRFVYESFIDSDIIQADLPPEERENRNLEDTSIDVVVHSRLKEGKVIPNLPKSYRNKAFFEITRSFPDVPEKAAENITKSSEAIRSIIKVSPKIRVTKTATTPTTSNSDPTIRTDKFPVIFKLGFDLNWGTANSDNSANLKNFRLVDIFPKELALKEKDIILNDDFIKYGGTYKREILPSGDTKLTFSSPSIVSSISEVATLHSYIRKGTPGDTSLTNRAYIVFDEDKNLPIKHEKPEKTPEENNKMLSTARVNLQFALNSAALVQKYIRSVSRNSDWQTNLKTEPDEDIEYKIEAFNSFRKPMEKFSFLDILPHINDTEVGARLDGTKKPRGSQFHNIMASSTLTSIVGTNILTNQVINYTPADFPLVLFSKIDDFPRSASEGEVRKWVKKALADQSYQTTNPAEAKAVYFGGDNSTIPASTKVEFVFKAKVPSFDFEKSEEWRGLSAINSGAFANSSQPEYREVQSASNTLVTPTRSIKFRKVDKVSKRPLEGATFVLKQRGEEDKVAISDKEGWLYFANVHYKPLTIQEIDAPKGYLLDETVFTYEGLNKAQHDKDIANPTFKNDIFYEVGDLVFNNELIPTPPPTDNRIYSLNITKKDVGDNPLAYVRFSLENMSDRSVTEAVSNKQGQLSFINLRPGQYRLKEVSNINRYTFIKPVYLNLPLAPDFSSSEFSSLTRARDPQNSDHEIYTIEIPNKTFNLELQKIGIEDLSRDKKDYSLTSTDGVKLPSVRFKLYETGIAPGNEIPADTGTLLADIVTDKKGKAKLENIKANLLYRLEEVEGYSGYELRREPIYFYLDETGGVKTADGNSYVRNDLLLVSNIREVVKSGASIRKIDAVTGDTLAGAKFQIFKQDGDRFVTMPGNSIQATDEQGVAYFSELEYGRYRIVEIEAPLGYVRSSERYEFTVQPYNEQHFNYVVKNKKMKLIVEKVQKIKGPFATDLIANEQKENEADQTGLFVANKTVYRRLRGAQFRLTPKYIDPLTKQAVPEIPIQPLKTENEEGYTVYEYSEGLSDFGSYLLEEVVAPNGFAVTQPYSIKIDQIVNYANPEASIYLENTPKTGSVYISKYADDAHTVLPGVTFALYKGHIDKADIDNHQAALIPPLKINRGREFSSMADNEKYGITDIDGITSWSNLDMGDYTIVEIATVDPYSVLEKATHFTLSSDNAHQRFSYYNRQDTITLKIQKTDDLKNPIEDLTGAQFELYHDGKFHSTGRISDKENERGIIYFESVPSVGRFEIREVTAPKGFAIVEPLVIEATENNKLANNSPIQQFKNKRQVKIKAKKTWVGGSENNRPDVYFKLYRKAEGEELEEAVPGIEKKFIGKINAEIDFGTFDAYKHEQGVDTVKAYSYFVKEVAEDETVLDLAQYDYEVSTQENVEAASAANDNLEAKTISVTNTYRPKQGKLTVTKIWRGGENSTKPNYKFILYRQVEDGPKIKVMIGNETLNQDVPTTAASGTNNLLTRLFSFFSRPTVSEIQNSVVFNNLDIFDENGKPYTYFVREVNNNFNEIPEDANFKPVDVEVEATKVAPLDADNNDLQATVVNTYHSPVTNIVALKEWVNGPEERPETHFFLKRYVKSTNLLGNPTYDEDEDFVSETKTLIAGSNDGSFANRVEFENLPTHNEKGEEYVYKSVEFNGTDRENLTWAPENYTKVEGTLENNNPLLTTNTYVPPEMNLIVKTTWKTYDGEQVPASTTYELKRNTGEGTENTVVLDPNQDNPTPETRITSKEKHNTKEEQDKKWKLETEKLAATNEKGTPYIYNITAREVLGYSKQIVDLRRDGKLIGFEIIYTPAPTSVKVNKVWNDDVNPVITSEIHPASVKVRLVRNGESYGNSVVLDKTQNWQHTFSNLPTHDHLEQEYTYSVEEVANENYTNPNSEGSKVAGYAAPVIAKNQDNTGYTITNNRIVEDIEVSKTWIDESADIAKPEKITINLYRNKAPGSAPLLTKDLREADNWSATFEKLPSFDNSGNKYIYTIDEENVPGYEKTINKYSVTNTRIYKQVAINKVWEELENENSYPNSITYILYRDGKEINRFTKEKPANPADLGAWNHTFTTDANGKKLAKINLATVPATDYIYTIGEETPTGYEIKGEIDQNNYIITNTQSKKEISVKKRWLKGGKPDVTLKLKRRVAGGAEEVVTTFNTNGQTRMEERDEQGNEYSVVVFPLAKYPTHNVEGQEYTYTLTEDPVPANYIPNVEKTEPTAERTNFVVTNTYKVELHSLQARVHWINGEIFKPNTQVRLFRKKQGEDDSKFISVADSFADQTVTRAGLKSEESIELEWKNVPETDENDGIIYIYQIRQLNGEDLNATIDNNVGWTPSPYSANRDNDLEITNRFTPPAKIFTLEKEWQMANENEIPPDSLSLTVKRGVHAGQIDEIVETITLNRNDFAGNVWQKNSSQAYPLQKLNGETYIYKVEEPTVNGYTQASIVAKVEDGRTVGFKLVNTQPKITISVEKEWVNPTREANSDSVAVQLLRNGKKYREATLRASENANENWRAEFSNLPKYAPDGQEYRYTVTETDIPAYRKEISETPDENGKFTIRNTRKLHDEIEVVKTWQDEANNLDRPSSIRINLLRKKKGSTEKEVVYDVLELTGQGNSWTGRFRFLPLTDNDGTEYVYTIQEEKVEGYETNIDNYSVTNTRLLKTIDVTKTWTMLPNTDEASYPSSITYKLYRDNQAEPIATYRKNKPAEPAKAGAWNYSFVEDKDGHKLPSINPLTKQAYNYSVREEVNEAFNSEETPANSYNFVNTQKSFDIEVKKRWLKGGKPDVTLKLKRSVAGGAEEVVTTLNTNGQTRTEEIDEQGNEYSVVVFPLAKYPTHNVEGQKYTYTLTEDPVPANYNSNVEKTELTAERTNFVVTNTYESPKIEKKPTIIWINGQTIVPTAYFRLSRRVRGQRDYQVISQKPTDNPAGTSDSLLDYVATRPGKTAEETIDQNSWTNLPKYTEDGELYEYKADLIDEDGNEFAHPDYTVNRTSLFDFRAEYRPSTFNLNLKKTWNLLAGETAPENVVFTLKRGFAADAIDTEVETYTVEAAGQNNLPWTYIVNDLPRNHLDGRAYFYSLAEKTANAYIEKIVPTKDQAGLLTGFTIENENRTRNISVEKEWVNPTREANPDSVTVQLLRNGEKYREATLRASENANENWRAEFTNLPTHSSDGQEYRYTVTETDIPAYRKDISETPDENGVFKVRNIRLTHKIEVSKVWNDEASDVDKPAKVTILLMRKLKNSNEAPSEYKRLELTGQGNNWTGEFTDLPDTNNAGLEYIYTIDEVAVPGYEKVINDYSVTNTRILITVPVTKTWDKIDEDYPASITYVLKRDGIEIASQEVKNPASSVNGSQNWNFEFINDKMGKKLAKNRPNSEEPYEYTVEERVVSGYRAEIKPTLNNNGVAGFAINNIQEKVKIKIRKRWLNGKKEDALLELQRKEKDNLDSKWQVIKEIRLKAANGTNEDEYTVTKAQEFELAKYSPTGKEYEYQLNEKNASKHNYKVEYSLDETVPNEKNFTVTNTYEKTKAKVKAKKVWQLLEKDIIVPSITIKLYRKLVNKDDAEFELVPEAEEKILPHFVFTEERGNKTIEIVWDNINQTDENGDSYEFAIREFKQNGVEGPPDEYILTHIEPLALYNTYLPRIPKLPYFPFEEEPNEPGKPNEPPKDNVPKTGVRRK